jgi:hypothetical protein
MTHQVWFYFLSIEKDFVQTLDFVHLHPANAKTFSNEYAKLLLLIGSEVDVVAKMLCRKIAPDKKAGDIDDYRSIIMAQFAGMNTVEIEIPKFNMKVQPWLIWDPKIAKSPDWWRAYNNVKHERDKCFPDANQVNTLYALCGLLSLLLYFYKDEPHLQPYPEILDYGFPSHIVTEGGKKLPGT